MAKFGKINYFTKIALVYLCLCQIFSQIEENERIYGKTGKRAKRENEDFKKKSGRAMFLIFWTPNFIPNFRKIVAAVIEI